MIGRDENQEEVMFKVADRRKFNPDGSVREGVTLDAEEPKRSQGEKPVIADERAAATAETASAKNETFQEDIEDDLDDDIPGADDPASFVNFLSTIATNAAAALGAVPHPATGQRTLDLDTGKYWIDVLSMIREKTKGNLHPKEERLFDGLLADMRMQYVTMVRATEEKLKAQAAKKFSSADILGKK